MTEEFNLSKMREKLVNDFGQSDIDVYTLLDIVISQDKEFIRLLKEYCILKEHSGVGRITGHGVIEEINKFAGEKLSK